MPPTSSAAPISRAHRPPALAARPIEQEDEGAEEWDAHVAGEDPLGKGRPEQDQRDPDPGDLQAAARRDRDRDVEEQDRPEHQLTGQGGEDGEKRQRVGRVEERLVDARPGRETARVVRHPAGEPAIGGEERRLGIDADARSDPQGREMRPDDQDDEEDEKGGEEQPPWSGHSADGSRAGQPRPPYLRCRQYFRSTGRGNMPG